MHPFFKDDDFQFATENVLGGVFHRAADVGEVLATIDNIPNGKAAAWVEQWSATADRLAGQAAADAEAGRLRSAAARYLRAANYYSEASDKADATPDPALFTALWEKHRDAWDRFVDLSVESGALDVERIAIPYEGTTLPGYFFRSGAADEPRRTLIYNNGSDGSVVGSWVRGVADALDRGWNAMTFDGPGQNAALIRQGIPFRPDWENVLTPVVDALAARADVDAARIAVMGVSQGGYWVPRAVAFEHRIAAAIADPGVVDVSTTMLAQLPRPLVKLLDAGDRAKFDREMGLGAQALDRDPHDDGLADAPLRRHLALRLLHRGPGVRPDRRAARRDHLPGAGHRPRARAVLARPVGADVRRADLPEGPRRLHRGRGCRRALRAAATGIRGERLFDWLDERVPAA